MGRKCVIKSCTNSATKKSQGLIKDVMFHRFPSNESRRNDWIVKIQVMANQCTSIPRRAVICSDHFEERSYVTKPYSAKVLADTAEPTIFGSVEERFSDVEILSIDCESEKDCIKTDKRYVILVEPTAEPDTVVEVCDIKMEVCERLISTYLEIKSETIEDNTVIASESQSQESEMSLLVPKSEPVEYNSVIASKFQSQESEMSLLEPKSEFTEDNSVITSECQSQPQLHLPLKPTRIRYPGDINELQSMSRRQLEHSVLLCKNKVKEQATTIAMLHRKVRNKESQLSRLRTLVMNLKEKFPSKHVANAMVKEVNKNFLSTAAARKKLVTKKIQPPSVTNLKAKYPSQHVSNTLVKEVNQNFLSTVTARQKLIIKDIRPPLVTSLKTKSPSQHVASTLVKEVNKNFLSMAAAGKILIKKDFPPPEHDKKGNEILGL